MKFETKTLRCIQRLRKTYPFKSQAERDQAETVETAMRATLDPVNRRHPLLKQSLKVEIDALAKMLATP